MQRSMMLGLLSYFLFRTSGENFVVWKVEDFFIAGFYLTFEGENFDLEFGCLLLESKYLLVFDCE